jgi:hypothetical protein
MAMHDIEAAIHELMEKANDQVADLATQSHEAAAAEHVFKRARAKLLLQAGEALGGRSSAEQREAWCWEQTTGPAGEVLADLDWQYRETAAIKEATVERGRMIRAQLDAMRTLAANVRPAMAHASGTGG